jgi:hypothetical protein
MAPGTPFSSDLILHLQRHECAIQTLDGMPSHVSHLLRSSRVSKSPSSPPTRIRKPIEARNPTPQMSFLTIRYQDRRRARRYSIPSLLQPHISIHCTHDRDRPVKQGRQATWAMRSNHRSEIRLISEGHGHWSGARGMALFFTPADTVADRNLKFT